MDRKRAFSLTELLIVIAIIAVLSAILFPVFSRAKDQAKASVCLSNFKQATISTMLYQSDYDDRYALSRYSTSLDATSRDDRTWVQLVLPYSRDFRLFRCPSDYTMRPESKAVFDEDLVPGDTYSRYYTASKRTNLGYNYMYLSPLILMSSQISAMSRSGIEINDPAKMLVLGDSVHEVDEDGRPRGGGSYLILPPCRYALEGTFLRDTFRLDGVPDRLLYQGGLSWGAPRGMAGTTDSINNGGLWPWHGEHLTAAFADGHIRRITIDQASDGCGVRPAWGGLVFDRERYLWDLD